MGTSSPNGSKPDVVGSQSHPILIGISVGNAFILDDWLTETFNSKTKIKRKIRYYKTPKIKTK